MSHHRTAYGRWVVECDEPVRATDGTLTRCRRRSRTAPEQLHIIAMDPALELGRGWSVAPYPDDCDHGATRTSLLDGRPIPPAPILVGLVGDLHTCPACNRKRHAA